MNGILFKFLPTNNIQDIKGKAANLKIIAKDISKWGIFWSFFNDSVITE